MGDGTGALLRFAVVFLRRSAAIAWERFLPWNNDILMIIPVKDIMRRETLEIGFESRTLVNDESGAFEDYQSLQGAHRKLQRWVIVLSLLLGLASFCTLLLSSRGVGNADPKERGPIPMVPLSTMSFERHDLFATLTSPESDEAWASMMPPSDGFVLIPNPREYKLPPGIPHAHGHGEIYDISLFHQLHCLKSIRTLVSALQSLVADNSTISLQTYWDSAWKPQEEHIGHCFDYLRQGIICAGDLTLEWPRIEEDGRRFAVYGWGIEHQCKSWKDAISQFEAKYSMVADADTRGH